MFAPIPVASLRFCASVAPGLFSAPERPPGTGLHSPCFNPTLPCHFFDCVWQRGCRPSKSRPGGFVSAGEGRVWACPRDTSDSDSGLPVAQLQGAGPRHPGAPETPAAGTASPCDTPVGRGCSSSVGSLRGFVPGGEPRCPHPSGPPGAAPASPVCSLGPLGPRPVPVPADGLPPLPLARPLCLTFPLPPEPGDTCHSCRHDFAQELMVSLCRQWPAPPVWKHMCPSPTISGKGSEVWTPWWWVRWRRDPPPVPPSLPGACASWGDACVLGSGSVPVA